jgi:hypothetical protein
MQQVLKRSGFAHARVYTQGILPHEIVTHLKSKLGKRAPTAGDATANPDRVQKSSNLNESVTQSPLGRIAKRVANGVLRTARLGDSLRVYAER